jgi:hypothetical protein
MNVGKLIHLTFIYQEKFLLEVAPFTTCDGCCGFFGPVPLPTLDEKYLICLNNC